MLAELNGIPVEAHLGRTMRELLPGLPSDEVEATWREVLRTGRPVARRGAPGGDARRARESAAPSLESWYPVRSGDEVLGLGALVRDVTAERAAQEFQRNVLGVVGHDLRNPLSALATSAQVLVRSERLPPELARVSGRILANAARMDRIISVLLDYARIRGGNRIPLHPRRCYLVGIVESAAEECEASHTGREVRRSGPGGVAGEWDPDRIAQILVNLLANALDYSPSGTPVELSWREDAAEVVLEIANAGPPIPAKVIPVLFEPFRRAERERPSGKDGLGLGLFIARAIAEAHGGRIDVRSAEGEATVFTLRLPIAPDRT